ncbi:MAG: glycerate kinase [Oscillospiraceae bacterium]|nr:glycerate kinase [Oscillospiraceae bacterium]
MKKIILIPDSFKGTITAGQFCTISEKVLKTYFPECEVISLPLADGGEGTTDCFLQMKGYQKVNTTAMNAFMEEIPVYYAVNGTTAVMEMAMCASLPSAKGRENPATTTTYGVGQLVRHAVENGAKKVILGLGGSCTNDAGAGMAAALGVKFFDEKGEEFIPTGQTLDRIASFDTAEAVKLLADVELLAMCDIDNPLYGINGAAYIFAPQKGADAPMVEMLDNKLQHIAHLAEKQTGINYYDLKGAGAAGGMGFGVCAFLGGSLQPGVNLILDTIDFDTQIQGADLVITGEGRIDSQSLSGKAVIGISRRAKEKNVPVIAVVGSAQDGYQAGYDQGLTAVFTTNTEPVPFEQAAKNAHRNLEQTVDNIARLITALEG